MTPEEKRFNEAKEKMELGLAPTIVDNQVAELTRPENYVRQVLEKTSKDIVAQMSEELPDEVVLILETHNRGVPMAQGSMWAALHKPYYMTQAEKDKEIPPHYPVTYLTKSSAYAALGIHVALAKGILARAARQSQDEDGWDIVEVVKTNLMKMDQALGLKIDARANMPLGEDVMIELISERRKVNNDLLKISGHAVNEKVKIKQEINNTTNNTNFNPDTMYDNFPTSGEDLEIIDATYLDESEPYPNTIPEAREE